MQLANFPDIDPEPWDTGQGWPSRIGGKAEYALVKGAVRRKAGLAAINAQRGVMDLNNVDRHFILLPD